MANTLPVPVKNILPASGGLAIVTLMEVLTANGNLYGWSDADLTAPSVLNPGASQVFKPWIITAPTFTQYKSTTTSTAEVTVQNLTGNTIQRDVAQIYAANELVGALIYVRLWKIEAEYSSFDFQGNIRSALIAADGDSMEISITGSYAVSAVQAPREQIGPTCGNVFNSGGSFYACGSVNATPCNNDYGTCTSLNRFAGILTEWISDNETLVQVAQQQPIRAYNPKVGG